MSFRADLRRRIQSRRKRPRPGGLGGTLLSNAPLAKSEASSYRRLRCPAQAGILVRSSLGELRLSRPRGRFALPFRGSVGGERVVVPDVVGLDVVSAYDAVREAGFAVQINEPVDVTPNQIARVSGQSPTAGAAGRRGTPMVLGLGHGPHGRLPMGGTQRVPRLVGKPLPDAVHTLQTRGLLWSAAPLPPLPATIRPSLLDNYRVTEQRPKPGTRFTQTFVRELGDGSVLTETSTVGLVAELHPT